ncbi:hypothetical protein SBA3_3140027 [Candidatus Sulfopaludibacter sp. SbA3]|nr:hypothetical protein SBA3_3140027 [Candidatus Sulfopaludibacter sp. SbA3]
MVNAGVCGGRRWMGHKRRESGRNPKNDFESGPRRESKAPVGPWHRLVTRCAKKIRDQFSGDPDPEATERMLRVFRAGLRLRRPPGKKPNQDTVRRLKCMSMACASGKRGLEPAEPDTPCLECASCR